jgi:phosphatidylglycerol lysyltransferase
MEYFGDAEGFLAYKQVAATAFVLSNPVAPGNRWENLIRRFARVRNDVCFWQASGATAKILEKLGFAVNEMGTETRIDLTGYDFNGPAKRNFRRALSRTTGRGYVTRECAEILPNLQELQTVSERWRQTRHVKNREMTFLTRPVVLDREVDVRKFFSFDREGRVQAFGFFDPIYETGEVVGYLYSAQRWLPEADALVGYAIMHHAIRTFQREGKKFLSLGVLGCRSV